MRLKAVTATIAAAIVLAGAGVSATAFSRHPTRPAWVRPDNTVDVSKLPDRIPVADAHGQVVGYISKADAFGSPAGSTGAVVRDDAGRVVGCLPIGKGFVRGAGC